MAAEKRWETDAEAFREITATLQRARNAHAAPQPAPDAKPPEAIVGELCRRVRGSPGHLLLPRLARQWRLTDEGIVCVGLVLLRWCGLPVDVSLGHVSLMACGLSPVSVARFRQAIRQRTGFGRLVRLCVNETLWPSDELLRELSPDALDFRHMSDELQRLPTTEKA